LLTTANDVLGIEAYLGQTPGDLSSVDCGTLLFLNLLALEDGQLLLGTSTRAVVNIGGK
jgi:hypothetical protein